MDFNVENYITNLSYINKDFPTLWNEILETVPKLTNKWIPNEANESDPLVVLLIELAIISDKLNYNIDKNILELFPATLTQERSAYNVYQSLGYTPDWYVSATTDLTIIYSGIINTATPDIFSDVTVGETKVTLPKFTPITNDDQTVNYVTMEDVEIYPGLVSKYTVPVIEGTINDFTVNGSTQITVENLDSQNRLFFTETNVAQNGIFISNYSDFSDFNFLVYGEVVTDSKDLWMRVDNLNQYEAGRRVYKLGIDAVNNSVYVQFPDDIGTLIEDGIYIKYILSSGEEGNVGTNELDSFLNEIELPIMRIGSSGKEEQIPAATASDGSSVDCKLVSSNFTLTNTASAQNGADPLDIEQMREEYNRIVGVFDTLVTVRDYENFIYNYTYLDGSHAISNIRVSDRSNDLYGTLKYITLSNDGTVSTVTDNLTGDLNANEQLTAYTLRLFPLQNVSAIDTKEDFDTTFNIDVDDNTKSHLNTELQSVVSDSKCVAHDFAPFGNPILINYDLEGQIYLKTSVSGTEAALIGEKVESKILQSLNSRELEWGRMVDYGTVVDIIKSADDRIQYVALNPIVYENPQEVDSDTNFGYDATIRTILSGDKAWTDFSQYAFNYSTSNIGNTYFGGVGSEEGPITGITTDVSISNPSTATSYIVSPNETFTILVPQYNSVTEYGNYLYMIAKSSSTDSPKVVADVPTQLTENQTIYIYQTRTAAEEAISSNTDRALRNNADYIIEPGTIIKSTADIEFSTLLTSSSLINMGGSIKVTTMERATGTIKPSNNITTGSDLYTLYIATNSEGLRTAFKATGAEQTGSVHTYTLVTDEYLFYTDSIGAELGVIGEGTTLTLSGGSIGTISDPDSGIYLIEKEIDVNNLINGSKDNNYLTTWTQISSRNPVANEQTNSTVIYGLEINYSLNELYTFGGNYIVEFGATTTTTSTNVYKHTITLSKTSGTESVNDYTCRFELYSNVQDTLQVSTTTSTVDREERLGRIASVLYNSEYRTPSPSYELDGDGVSYYVSLSGRATTRTPLSGIYSPSGSADDIMLCTYGSDGISTTVDVNINNVTVTDVVTEETTEPPVGSLVETVTTEIDEKVPAFESSIGDTTGDFPKNFTSLASSTTPVTSVRYQLLNITTDVNGVQEASVNDSAWEYLDSLMANDPYQYLVKLSFVAGPGVEQEITSRETITMFTNVALQYNAAQTKQSVTMYANSIASSGCSATIESGNSAQATSLLMYAGGLEETYATNSNVGVMYRRGRSDETSFSNGFTTVATIINSNTIAHPSIYFPGNASQVAIFPYIEDETGHIGYGAINGGSSVSVTNTNTNGVYTYSISAGGVNIVSLGIPRVANNSAVVYELNNHASVSTTIGNMMNGATGIKILRNNYLYVEGFYPLQTVDANYAINNPQDANSYFMSNHPYNRYVMPHLNNYNKLIISPMSILN